MSTVNATHCRRCGRRIVYTTLRTPMSAARSSARQQHLDGLGDEPCAASNPPRMPLDMGA